MCGIFGIFSPTGSHSSFPEEDLSHLANYSLQRGRDSSGFVYLEENTYKIKRADISIDRLLSKQNPLHKDLSFLIGHSRLVTNGLIDNQPVLRKNTIAIHNGIIVNTDELWATIKKKPLLSIDSEIIPAFVSCHLETNYELGYILDQLLLKFKGVVSTAIVLPALGKIILLSNNGSLFTGTKNNYVYFASERFPLTKLGVSNIQQVSSSYLVFDLPTSNKEVIVESENTQKSNLVPSLAKDINLSKLLVYDTHKLRRCTKCILPETMPFITFDERGVCNYCNNYKPRNIPKPKDELLSFLEPYKKSNQSDCIIPFSGGRDSCYTLHLAVKELGLKPITYTYDWGMVTDLGRRNISRMSSQLGIENIIIAADIVKKRRNIRTNFLAWLKSPNLGMISILTAGDKHFFRHIETIKQQTGIPLNLWGINPLEITHFKSGFLGIPPYFDEKMVYSSGLMKQIRYQAKRLQAMANSPSYFNKSLFDTISGEYYRSFTKKTDYYHMFDYWRWCEKEIDSTLINVYDWETAVDTKTTWRIGDGTAAIYNYIYYTVAGFTEHDTFRSNQIREGDICREHALELVQEENRPRFENIKWYFDAIEVDFSYAIDCINKIPRHTH